MIVYLLRHGIAADVGEGSFSDDERPLTERGIQSLTRAATVYARLMIPPDRVLTSPLVRARQSAEILATQLRHERELVQSPALHYSTSPTQVLDELQNDMSDDADAIVLVGHEPQLGNLLGLMLTGSERVALPLSKSMLAAVDITTPQSMIGRLLFCLSAKTAHKLD